MVILKKIKGSSLIETMVATVLIVLIFMISSMVLNSLLAQSAKANTQLLVERMIALEYQYKNNPFPLPYENTNEDWKAYVYKENIEGISMIKITITDLKTQKSVYSYSAYEPIY